MRHLTLGFDHNSAGGTKDAVVLFYRTSNGEKHGPEEVTDLEHQAISFCKRMLYYLHYW